MIQKKLLLLPLLFLTQQALANPNIPHEAAANDKCICHLNDQADVELKTTLISESNPEYWKEAELAEGLKANFAQLYYYYGMRSYSFSLTLDDRVIATSQVNLEENYLPLSFGRMNPTLSLDSDVTLAGQNYHVRCDFIFEGNLIDNPPDTE